MAPNNTMSVEEDNLRTFSRYWFFPHCAWKIPDVTELQTKTPDELKALVSKSVIGLRPAIEKNDSAIKAFPKCADTLVSAHLDAIALKFGYANESQSAFITNKKDQALKDYEKNQTTIEALNSNLGLRAAACIFLLPEDKTKTVGKNLLSIMNLLNARETSILKGKIKCELLKFSMSMCNELKRTEYASVIEVLEKELSALCEKVKTAIERIPAGVIGKESVKALIENALSAVPPNSDPKIKLIQTFDVVIDVYAQANTATAQKLSGLVLPIEKEHGIISIDRSH